MDMTDEQLDEMLLDKRLEEARARESTPAAEPAGEDNAPIQIPYKPGKQPPKEAPDRSYLESFGRGALQGYTSGFADELAGRLESLGGAKDYKTARDESRKAYREAEEANPVTYNVGTFGGAVGQALTPGYNVVAKGGPAVQGGIFALGATEAEKPEDMATDVGLGAVTGYATGKLFDKAANLKKYLSNVAEQRAYKAAAGQSLKDIKAEQKAGRITMDREGISMARGRDLLSKDEAGPPAVGWFSRAESIQPKVEAKREYFGKAISGVGKAIDEANPEGAISSQELSDIIQREMSGRVSTTGNEALQEKLASELDHIFKDKPNMTFAEAQKYKNAFQWKPAKNVSAPQEYEFQTMLHNAFSEAMENAADRAKSSIPDAGKYPYYKGKYASYRGAADQAEARSLQNLSNRFVSPSDYFSGGLGGAAGYAAGGDLFTGMAAGAATSMANKFARERGSAFAARSADLVSKALESGSGALGKYAPILGESMQRGTANFILNHTLLMKSDPEYQRIVESLAQ